MVRSNLARGLCVVLLLVGCGGLATTEPSGAPAQSAGTGGISGADASINTCGGAADGGCAGEGGERPLEPYARLRTACSRNVKINRQGEPISIDCHIQ